jgi:hypothetical protein
MWYRGPYFILSCVLLLAVLAFPLAADLLGAMVLQVVTTLLLLSALYAVIESKTLFRVMAVIIVPTVVVNWLVEPDSHPYLLGGASLATMLFYSITFVAILRNVATSKEVTADVIFGSIAAYLLFGIVLALAFYLVNSLDPGNAISSITTAQTEETGNDVLSEFLYFSFVTLTSVGFGDIHPTGSVARSLAMFEAIFGQLYVAILIARLVSIHISQQ